MRFSSYRKEFVSRKTVYECDSLIFMNVWDVYLESMSRGVDTF